jgi:predicted transcriptional regulator
VDNTNNDALIELTAEIVAAYVSNNNVRREELAALIGDIHAALTKTPNGTAAPEQAPQEPSVPVRKSVTPDHIFCLEDGKKFKSLKRHLRTDHNLTPQQYRAKWNLKPDYPMVAPNYAEARSNLAKNMGLGRRAPASEQTEAAPAAAKKTAAKRTK